MEHDFIKDPAACWTHLKIPKIFFYEEPYRNMSASAIILYSLFLERATTAGYISDNGAIYIHYSAQEIMDALHCSVNTTTKYLKELEAYGLIERRIKGPGKQTRIYVKEFFDGSTADYQYAFFFVLKALFDEKYDTLPLPAKIYYSILIEQIPGSESDELRMSYPVRGVMKHLNCTGLDAANVLKRLSDHRLIRMKYAGGSGIPEKICPISFTQTRKRG